MSAGRTLLSDFQGGILVRCPACSGCAHLIELPREPNRSIGFRFVCSRCTATRDWLLARDGVIPGPNIGPELHGFGLSLWLQTECCGEVLWAYNTPHLAFLERYVGAKMRSVATASEPFLGNQTLESRLPRWMLSAKNRETVLKGLRWLRTVAIGGM